MFTRNLNLGILAHVDAGKTTLTERLLYAAGVIGEVGSVDKGTTQTDSLALERQRGITIRSAVVSFPINDVAVNLIDTPGHPDFIAEVERVLSVLDGAVLILSAVEGVQSQTRLLMRTLQRLRIPTLLFVNKVDRVGADPEGVLEQIADQLTPSFIAMGSVRAAGTREAEFLPSGESDDVLTSALADLLALHDDSLLAELINGDERPSYNLLRTKLVAQTRSVRIHPVYYGSAITGTGVDELMSAIVELLPATDGNSFGDQGGAVFKVERGPAGEKIAYVRMFSGELRTRDRVKLANGGEAKVTAVRVFDCGDVIQRSSVKGGQIAKLWGLADVRIGDRIGNARPSSSRYAFAPPALETVVIPRRFADKGRLRMALGQLAEQDPLINVRQDDLRQELYLSLYGEVQKEVIEETLATDFGLEVDFQETTAICVERPIGVGESVEFIRKGGNPFLATVGLRVRPVPIGNGAQFQRSIEVHGKMPPAFFNAVEETVLETLHQGLYGWQVTDCAVTMTHAGYYPRQSHAHQGFSKAMSSTGADFRCLTPLVLMAALKQAQTTVCEPAHRFRIELPTKALQKVLSALARLSAVPETPAIRGGMCTLQGELRATQVHQLRLELASLTRGEGVLETELSSYQPVHGEVPLRPRSNHNPLNREEYLLHIARRI